MGIKYTSVTNVALITSFNCIFTQLLFRAFKNEKFGLNRIVATLLLMFIILLTNEFKITNFNSGDLAVLIFAFCLSLNIFCVSTGKTSESDLNSITLVSIIVCGVLALFITSAGEPTIGNSISLKILINYLYMIILGISFFYIMQNILINKMNPVRYDFIISLESIWPILVLGLIHGNLIKTFILSVLLIFYISLLHLNEKM